MWYMYMYMYENSTSYMYMYVHICMLVIGKDKEENLDPLQTAQICRHKPNRTPVCPPLDNYRVVHVYCIYLCCCICHA